MSADKILSIITPVFNGKRFIEFCIKNVIEQKCPVLEHIIVDGGSTDGTVEVIKSYAVRYGHIRWVTEKDKGQSDAMNKGIALSRAKVVGFLNVDDYYEPFTLNRIIEYFTKLSEPGLLVGNCNVWGDDDKFLFVNRPRHLKLRQLLLGFDLFPWPVNSSAYFYHKKLHDRIGPYNVEEHFALDLDFIFRAVEASNVTYIDEVLGNYRLLKGTKTFTDIEAGCNLERSRKMRDCHVRTLNWFWRLLFPFYRYYWVVVQPRIRYYVECIEKSHAK